MNEQWTEEEVADEMVEVVPWRYGRRLRRRSRRRCERLWMRLGLLSDEKAKELDEHTDEQ